MAHTHRWGEWTIVGQGTLSLGDPDQGQILREHVTLDRECLECTDHERRDIQLT